MLEADLKDIVPRYAQRAAVILAQPLPVHGQIPIDRQGVARKLRLDGGQGRHVWIVVRAVVRQVARAEAARSDSVAGTRRVRTPMEMPRTMAMEAAASSRGRSQRARRGWLALAPVRIDSRRPGGGAIPASFPARAASNACSRENHPASSGSARACSSAAEKKGSAGIAPVGAVGAQEEFGFLVRHGSCSLEFGKSMTLPPFARLERAARSSAFPLDSRDITVPIGISRALAISR